jgi:RND family efflux transporter MFP subunit
MPRMNADQRSRVVTVLLALTAAACGGSRGPEAREPGGPPLTVTTAAASVVPIRERLEAGGTVAAEVSATLTSRILSAVKRVRVRAGDPVRAGDVLVVLDDRDVAAGTRGARASVSAAAQGLAVATSEQAAAVADHKLAAASHVRIASLHQRRSATTQELDEAEARLAAVTARVEGAKARVEQAAFALTAARAATDAAAATESFSVLTAPFDGFVTERLTDPGNLAAPGTPLLRLDSLGTPHVVVTVDEAREQYVHAGDRVEVLFEARSGEQQAAVEGVVTEVARIAADVRGFAVKVSLPRASPRTGTFARVRFRGASREALVIPAAAVRRQGQLATAFVVEDGVARLRLLRLGYEGGEGVEVLAGIESGEMVVTVPPPGLVDGRRVALAAARAGAGR